MSLCVVLPGWVLCKQYPLVFYSYSLARATGGSTDLTFAELIQIEEGSPVNVLIKLHHTYQSITMLWLIQPSGNTTVHIFHRNQEKTCPYVSEELSSDRWVSNMGSPTLNTFPQYTHSSLNILCESALLLLHITRVSCGHTCLCSTTCPTKLQPGHFQRHSITFTSQQWHVWKGCLWSTVHPPAAQLTLECDITQSNVCDCGSLCSTFGEHTHERDIYSCIGISDQMTIACRLLPKQNELVLQK